MSIFSILFTTVIFVWCWGVPCSVSHPIHGASVTGKLNGTTVAMTTTAYVTSTENFGPTIHAENKTNPVEHRTHDDVSGSQHMYRRLLESILKLTRYQKDRLLRLTLPSANSSETGTLTMTSATMRNTSDDQQPTTGSRGGVWAWFFSGQNDINMSSVRSLLGGLHSKTTATNTTTLPVTKSFP